MNRRSNYLSRYKHGHNRRMSEKTLKAGYLSKFDRAMRRSGSVYGGGRK